MSETTNFAVEVAAQAASASIGSKVGAGMGGAGVGVWGMGWLFTSEFGVASGFVLALLGVAINWYYRRKEYRLKVLESELRQADEDRKKADERRREEIHQAQLRALRGQP